MENNYNEAINKSLTAITRLVETQGYGKDFKLTGPSSEEPKDAFTKYWDEEFRVTVDSLFPCYLKYDILAGKNAGESINCTFILDWTDLSAIHINRQDIEKFDIDGRLIMSFIKTIASDSDIMSLNDASKAVTPRIPENSCRRTVNPAIIEDVFLHIDTSIKAKGFDNFIFSSLGDDISPEAKWRYAQIMRDDIYTGSKGRYFRNIVDWSGRDAIQDPFLQGTHHLPFCMQTTIAVERNKSSANLCTFIIDQMPRRPSIVMVVIEKINQKGEKIAAVMLPIKSLKNLPTKKQLNQLVNYSSRHHKDH
jgi:hypothetical protein